MLCHTHSHAVCHSLAPTHHIKEGECGEARLVDDGHDGHAQVGQVRHGPAGRRGRSESRLGYQAMGYQAMGYQAMGYRAMGYQATRYWAMMYQAMGYQAMGYHLKRAPHPTPHTRTCTHFPITHLSTPSSPPQCPITHASTSPAEVESRPLVGSSRKMMDGLPTSSRPMFTRLRWPPLMPAAPPSRPAGQGPGFRSGK